MAASDGDVISVTVSDPSVTLSIDEIAYQAAPVCPNTTVQTLTIDVEEDNSNLQEVFKHSGGLINVNGSLLPSLTSRNRRSQNLCRDAVMTLLACKWVRNFGSFWPGVHRDTVREMGMHLWSTRGEICWLRLLKRKEPESEWELASASEGE